MPQSYFFHIRPQSAGVLLGPACDELARVQTRLAHYADHIRMTDADIATMRRAADTVAAALAELEGLRATGQEE